MAGYIVRLVRVDKDNKRYYGYVQADGAVSEVRSDAHVYRIRYNAERIAALMGRNPWMIGEVRAV